ncbi:hypothetical protein LJB84_00645 [Bacteroidales bacterium OttesenSCG-928-J19]|nr:hypothetical protein [Bacteroidales bacterium OttesenSCG-928-J19]
MTDLIETLTTGTNGKILFAVIALLLFVYVPYLLFYQRKRKDKQAIFEHENRDAIKVYLELDIIGTLTVCSINGEKPTPFYETTRQGFFLCQGDNTIEVQYHWHRRSPFFIMYENFNIEPRELNVFVEKNKTYSLGYNIDKDKYEFNEVNTNL